MKLKDYIRQKELRAQQAERGFILRMRRALRKTIEPIYEQFNYTTVINVDGLRGNHIKEALKWLYVTWGYRQMIWFSRNFEYQKKNDIWLTGLESYFETIAAKKITGILETTKELVRKAIKEPALEGLSIDKIQKVVKVEMEKDGGPISMGRARTIARTEVMGASNTATHQAVNAATGGGSNMEKRWVTGGLNVRSTHEDAESQGWIPFNESFRVGLYLMQHPHDSSGGSEEVVNCKCVEIYRTID